MIKYLFISLFCFITPLFSLDFKVASYNVENLFDLNIEGNEYKEYVPNSKYWNKRAYKNKLSNIAKVINHLDAHIICLQEVESKKALNDLIKLTKYKHYRFLKKPTTSVGTAILSRFPIKSTKHIEVNRFNKRGRYIMRSTVNINSNNLIIYNNHWRSKRAPESKRIYYATALKKDIEKLKKGTDYIILGDLNSDYNEFESFKYNKKLNDTYGITGINQILNTSYNGNMIHKKDILSLDETVRYNLWLELKKKNRFSTKFKGRNNTPDNMIITKALFDNKNISYINNSFKVFKPEYLMKKSKIKRWNHKKSMGYSDHLPIYGYFSTKPQNYSFFQTKKDIKNKQTISYLYTIESLTNPIILNDVTVIYKHKKVAVIAKKGDRNIMVYNRSNNLKEGFTYDLRVESIDRYNGLKEIKDITVLKQKEKYKNYKELYLDPNGLDLFDLSIQNSIITALKGVYKKGYLYYGKNGKIRLYFKKGIKKPEDGENITVNSGHLGIFRSKVQIVIYRKGDILY